VVPKHRRSELYPSLASYAPMDTAESWPEAVGYGQAAATAVRASAGPDDYPAAGGYDGGPEPGWSSALETDSWQDWQDWGPPPELHPDHPSAPVPRIQLPADHPSQPLPAVRGPRPPDLPQRRPGASARASGASQPPQVTYDRGNRRLYAVPNDPPASDYDDSAPQLPEGLGRQFPVQLPDDLTGPDWRKTNGYQRQPGPARRENTGYQRQPRPVRREPAGYQRQPGRDRQDAPSYRPGIDPYGPGPATGGFRDDRRSGRDSLRAAEQDQLAQLAHDYAAQIRDAAEREAQAITRQATTIREAAEREAAELRVRFDSITGELNRVATYVTENLAALPATAPALPALPAMPDTESAPPDTRPARPEPDTQPRTRPARPATGSAPPIARPARPARPATSPAAPARQPATLPNTQQKPNRQLKAMRFATAGTAALLSIAAIGAVTYTSIHGFSFFVFRESAQGETPGSFTDANFLAGQKECRVNGLPAVCPAPQHHDSAPKGRHHKAAASK
jgi:hypothetical protein